MGVLDNPEGYRSGKTAYADIGVLYRASFDVMAQADPPPGAVAWRVWGAVMGATASWSKLADRTSLNTLADAAGIRRKGSKGMSGRREEARTVAAALGQLKELKAISYRPAPARSGRPAAGSYVPVLVGLPDPEVIGVSLTPIPAGKGGSGRAGNGGQDGRKMGVKKTPPTEEGSTEKQPSGFSAALMAARGDKPGAFRA